MKKAEEAIEEVQTDLRNIASELTCIAEELKRTQSGIAEDRCAKVLHTRANKYNDIAKKSR